MDRGAIEWAINVESGKIEGEEASDGSRGAKEWTMDVTSGAIEGAMDQLMDQGVRDGSRRNSKERWIRGQAVVQKGIEGAIIMFIIMSQNDSILK